MLQVRCGRGALIPRAIVFEAENLRGEGPPSATVLPASQSAPFGMKKPARIYLSSPHMGTDEFELVRDAFASNWIAPLGPHVDAFEREFAALTGSAHAAALSSGTAALHLALRLIGVRAGDEVLCSTLTFSASANPIVYEGARPVFVDSERTSWNMDPARLEEALAERARKGRRARAVILVHLYGQSADI